MTFNSPLRNRLAGLDTLRALAIVVVMIFHLQRRLPDSFSPIGRFGWMGVDLFFVLSGYLIGSQLLKPVRDGRRISLLGFYRKRAYRILPVYLVVLGLYSFWPAWREAAGLSPVWQFLTFTENFFIDYQNNQAFSHVWSLCVEEHFYLLLPIIVMMLAKRPAVWKTVAALAFFFALGLVTRSYEFFHVLMPMGRGAEHFSTDYIERIYYPTYARLDGLLAGVALALVRMLRPKWWERMVRHANVLLLAGVASTACVLWIFTDRFGPVGTVIGFPLMATAMAMLVAAGSDTPCWFGRLRFPGAKLVAMLAFSLYLTHKEVAHLDELYFPGVMSVANWRSASLIAASCLAVAAALYFAVERPFLVLRDRQGTKHADVEARAEPAL
jgi:peptidoglycan/LPS O-acetylase OafA/YrhL